jgi:hypothetical protein
MSERPQVTMRLEYVGPPAAYVQKLKAALKALGRTFHFRCVGLTELPAGDKDAQQRNYR